MTLRAARSQPPGTVRHSEFSIAHSEIRLRLRQRLRCWRRCQVGNPAGRHLVLCQQRLHDLEKTAKKLYEEAYVIKSTNAEQAIKKLDTVLKIIPPTHIYYTKAKRLRTNIQGPICSESPDDSGV